MEAPKKANYSQAPALGKFSTKKMQGLYNIRVLKLIFNVSILPLEVLQKILLQWTIERELQIDVRRTYEFQQKRRYILLCFNGYERLAETTHLVNQLFLKIVSTKQSLKQNNFILLKIGYNMWKLLYHCSCEKNNKHSLPNLV